jgi:tetratricopeptide (TPR) repeat protein
MKATLHRILTITFLAAITSTSVLAQNTKPTGKFGATPEDSTNCVRNQTLYFGYYDQKNYDMSVTFWRQNFNECPASSENIYIRGQVMFTHFYDQTKDKGYIDTLMLILDRRSEYFGNKTTFDHRKAYMLQGYSDKHPELRMESYKIIDYYLKNHPEQVEVSAIGAQIVNTVNLYNSKQLTQEDVINDYSLLIEVADKLIAANPATAGQLVDLKAFVDNLFRQSGVATCDNLIPLFTPQVKARPQDPELLKKVLGLLDYARCTNSDLYYTSAESLYKIEKSSNAAYNLATMNIAKKNYSEAEKYFLEAVEMETDPLNKSNYLNMLATFELQSNNYVKARDFAKQAIEYNPNNGAAHLIIGTAYASTRLGDDEFENKTVFWIAVDYLVKAKNLDPQLSEKANESIEACSANFPKKDEAFFVGIYDEGAPYTVKGWINERTTVRFRK